LFGEGEIYREGLVPLCVLTPPAWGKKLTEQAANDSRVVRVGLDIKRGEGEEENQIKTL